MAIASLEDWTNQRGGIQRLSFGTPHGLHWRGGTDYAGEWRGRSCFCDSLMNRITQTFVWSIPKNKTPLVELCLVKHYTSIISHCSWVLPPWNCRMLWPSFLLSLLVVKTDTTVSQVLQIGCGHKLQTRSLFGSWGWLKRPSQFAGCGKAVVFEIWKRINCSLVEILSGSCLATASNWDYLQVHTHFAGIRMLGIKIFKKFWHVIDYWVASCLCASG